MACSDLRARASRSAASCDHQRATPLVAPHPRCSFVSFVSRPRAPATAVPPSFPRSFSLRREKRAESAACGVDADAGSKRTGDGTNKRDGEQMEGMGII